MIKDDPLEDLEGRSKGAPGIILKKGNKRGPVETKGISQGILFRYGIGMLGVRAGPELVSRKLGDVVRLRRVVSYLPAPFLFRRFVVKIFTSAVI